VDQLEPLGAGGARVSLCKPEQGQQAGREIEMAGLGIPVPETFIGAPLGEYVAFAGVAQLLFRLEGRPCDPQ
jgi:hypothetical protein